MIPQTEVQWQPDRWQQALRLAFRRPADLLAYLDIPRALATPSGASEIAIEAASEDFSMLVPRGFADRMQRGNPNDPLLLQVLPSGIELLDTPGYSKQPLQEGDYNPAPGVIHKYRGRALLIATGGCAVNCRYCFRRHFDYSSNRTEHWQTAIDYLSRQEDLHEVILSGGDPLLLTDGQLGELLDQLAGIRQLRRLRIHTRLPVVLPERVNRELVRLLRDHPLRTALVIHSNHAQELDDSVAPGLDALDRAGVTLLNQSVLLAGINDSVTTLEALSERLFELRVQPYYLHLLDPVQGAAHFEVSQQKALQLHTELKQRLSGFLVPKLVREVPGAAGKVEQFTPS